MKHVLSLVVLMSLTACGVGRGERGTHVGIITDVSEAGWLCKTLEGQVMSGAGNAAMHYEFTISDEIVAGKLREAQKSGREVIVHYYSPAVYSLCSTSHSNIVTAVEFK